MKKDSRYSSSSRRRESPEDDRRGRDYRSRYSPPGRSRRSRSRSRSRIRDDGEDRNRRYRDYRNREDETRKRQRESSPVAKKAEKSAPVAFVAEKDVQLDADLSPEEIQMMIAMGIPFGFDTTQGRHVEDEGANQGAVKTATKRTARQYMNRKRGFNRPLPSEKTGERITGD